MRFKYYLLYCLAVLLALIFVVNATETERENIDCKVYVENGILFMDMEDHLYEIDWLDHSEYCPCLEELK